MFCLPLTPPDCVIGSEIPLPIDVSYWRDSKLAIAGSADAFRASLLLSFASWTQVPCGSVPNDDVLLAALSGLGRTKRSMTHWHRIKEAVLAEWVLCDDGRFYHPKICEQAIQVWQRMEKERRQRERSAQRTYKSRKEARSIRAALKALSVQTSSLTSLNELRRIAAEHGLTQYAVPLTGVSAARANAYASQSRERPTGVYGGQAPSMRGSPPVDAVTNFSTPQQEKPLGSQAETLDLFGDDPIVLSSPVRKKDNVPAVNYEEFVDAYHQGMPGNPRVVVISEKRRREIKKVWRESSKLDVAPFNAFKSQEDGLAAWSRFFHVCNNSSFLRGEGRPGPSGRRFCPSLDFFLKIDNVIKTVEGKYHTDGEKKE